MSITQYIPLAHIKILEHELHCICSEIKKKMFHSKTFIS